MPAIFAAHLVAAHNGRHGIPAVDGADAPFHLQITGEIVLIIHGDGVLIRRGCGKGQRCACGAGLLYGLVQQVMRPVRTVAFDHILNGILPFL